MITVGLILIAIGEGKKGFKSSHLKLVGPVFLVLGVIFALLWTLILLSPKLSKTLKCRKFMLLFHPLSGGKVQRRNPVPPLNITIDNEKSSESQNEECNTSFIVHPSKENRILE